MPLLLSQLKFIQLLRKVSIFAFSCAAASSQAFTATTGANTELIEGHRVESLTKKKKDSTVCIVFENGSRSLLDSWSKVIDLLPPNASVFAYNRPGYGNSQETGTPRDGSTIIEELKRNLKYEGLTPPYILVGHSLGGLYMQLFAKRYPNEVSGIVLIDSLYPRMVKNPEEFPLLSRGAKRLFFSKTVNSEIDLIYTTGEQVLSLPSIDDKPIFKLINKPTGSTAISVNFGMFNFDDQTVSFVNNLYPKAKKIVVDSDHQMQSQSPVEVVEAIKTIIDTAQIKN